VDSGWVPHDIRVEEMEAAVRTICEPIFDRPLKDISFGVVLLRLFEVLRRFDARIQPQLILLQKTLFNIEGLGRQLYPDLDIWNTANPILREWMREKRHPLGVARRMWKQMPELLRALEAAPVALRQSLVARSNPVPRVPPPAPNTSGGRITAAIVLLAGVIALNGSAVPHWLGWVISIAGGICLVSSYLRSGR
jgi:ubiquinone biosynthesis protein